MNMLIQRLDRSGGRLQWLLCRVLACIFVVSLGAAAQSPPTKGNQDFLQEAREAFGRQEFDQARLLLEPLAAGKGATAEIHALLGLARIQLPKPDFTNGVASLRRALALDADQVEAHLGMGLLYNRQKQSMRALMHLKKVVILRPKWSEGHLQAGIALYDLGRLEDAKGEFKQATSVPAAVEYLALIESAQGQHLVAAELMKRLLEHTPAQAEQRGRLLYQRAAFLRKGGRDDEAAQALQAALKAGYDRLEVHQLLGDIAYDQEKLESALQSYRRALDKPSIRKKTRDLPPTAELLYHLGLVLYRQEKYAEARVQLERCVAQNAFHPNAWYKLGQTLTRLKSRPEARSALKRHREVERFNKQFKSAQRSLTNVPDNLKNRLTLISMLEHMKRWEAAFDHLRIIEQTAPKTPGLIARLRKVAQELGRQDLVAWYEKKLAASALDRPEGETTTPRAGKEGQ
jgi:tetratricopeptide (TPR) repeat protein